MVFTAEQLIAIFGIFVTVIAFCASMWLALDKKIGGLRTEMTEAFVRANSDRHLLRSDLQARLMELDSDIDRIRDSYARREDILNLAAAMNKLSDRLDKLTDSRIAAGPH